MRCLWILALAGCGAGLRVQVVDDAGRPIRGAEVQVVYPSFNNPAVLTDAEGVAVVAYSGRPLALHVEAPGHRGHASGWLDIPERQVTLDRLPPDDGAYEFIASIASIGRLGALPEGTPVLATQDVDLRWFVELRVRSVVAGSCPVPPGSVVRYAVHSTTHFLGGRHGGDVRVRGRRLRGGTDEVTLSDP